MRWIHNFNVGKSPCRVNQASAVIEPFVYSFGGYCQQSTVNELKKKSPIDVHVLNTISFKWHKRNIPEPDSEQYQMTPYFRYGHTCVVFNDYIYLWGGRADWTNALCNKLYCYDPDKHIWKAVDTIQGQIPEGRDGHSACVIENSMYIFGGYVQRVKRFSNDVYEFNFQDNQWTLIVPKSQIKPYWRDFHTASVVGHNMYIFGGRMDLGRTRFTGQSFYSNDLFCFNVKTKKWNQVRPDTSNRPHHSITDSNNNNNNNNNTNNQSNDSNTVNKFSPSGRRSHSAVVYNNKIMIFGGFNENLQKHYNDLYEYDPVKNEWRTLSPQGEMPSARRRHSCCIVNNQMFVFGGTGPSQTANSSLSNESSNSTISNLQTTMEQILRHLTGVGPNILHDLTRERNRLNVEEINQALRGWIRFEQEIERVRQQEQEERLQANQLHALVLREPQREYQDNIRELNENDDEQINVDLNNNNHNQLNIVQNNIHVDMEDTDDDDEFDDSDSEDLINEETEDEDDFNFGLVSLSDLHIMQFGVPSLRSLSALKIIKENIDYSTLPECLRFDINCLLDSTE